MLASSPRRSGRARRVTYNLDDPFEGLDLGSDDDPREEPTLIDRVDSGEELSDFEDDAEAEVEEEVAEAEISDLEEPISDGGDIDENDGADFAEEDLVRSAKKPSKKRPSHPVVKEKKAREQANQGQEVQSSDFRPSPHLQPRLKSFTLVRNARSIAKHERVKHLFGDTESEVIPALRARDKWCSNPALPTRAMAADGAGGLAYSFHHTEAIRKEEATEGWNWYEYSGGKEQLSGRQKFTELNDAFDYMPQPEQDNQRVLLGPIESQKMYNLTTYDSIGLHEAFKMGTEDQTQQRGKREGWVLNVGAKVRTMQWNPNRSEGWRSFPSLLLPCHGLTKRRKTTTDALYHAMELYGPSPRTGD
jgi:transcription factor C subunit 6